MDLFSLDEIKVIFKSVLYTCPNLKQMKDLYHDILIHHSNTLKDAHAQFPKFFTMLITEASMEVPNYLPPQDWRIFRERSKTNSWSFYEVREMFKILIREGVGNYSLIKFFFLIFMPKCQDLRDLYFSYIDGFSIFIQRVMREMESGIYARNEKFKLGRARRYFWTYISRQ